MEYRKERIEEKEMQEIGDKIMIRKERKVGEIFEFEGVKLQVVDIGEYGNGCNWCYFHYNCSGCYAALCTKSMRSDYKEIIYKIKE